MFDFRQIKKEMHLSLPVCEYCGGIGLVDWNEKKQEWGLACDNCGEEVKDE